MRKSLTLPIITRARDDASSNRRPGHHSSHQSHPGQLLNSAALHFAQGRLLLCRALPSLDQSEALDVRTLVTAMQRVIVRLTRAAA